MSSSPTAIPRRAWRALLLSVALAACAHSAPPPPAVSPAERQETEERIRQEMSGDAFAETDAGQPPASAGGEAPEPPPEGDPFAPVDAGLPPAHSFPPPAARTAPEVDPRRESDAAMAKAVATARTQKPADCAHTLVESRHAHADADPPARQALLQQEAKCEERAKDVPTARDTALFLLASCGPDHADRCRARAKALIRRLAGAKTKDPGLLKTMSELDKADACVAAVDRAKNPTAPCVEPAEAVYRHVDDKLMLARLHLAEAHAAIRGKKEPELEHRFTKALNACADPRCLGVRGQVYDAEARWLETQKRYEDVARARINQNHLVVEAALPGQRSYIRSPVLDRACAAYDAQKGAGSCRALELRLTGGWTFHDHSSERQVSELDPNRVKAIGDEFSITLQDCFREQATRLPVPSEATYKLSWMVGNDGRVAQLHIVPSAEESLPLGACLHQRFEVWRYPRSTGENPHVDQSFTISAKER